MIDFRYHLVSLISVFLALAVGIALGAGPLKESIGDTLTGQVEQLRAEKDELRAQLDTVEGDLAQADAAMTELGPSLLEGVLGGRRVALVVLDEVDPTVVDSVSTAIGRAGGTVSAVATVSEAWTDPTRSAFRQSLAGTLLSYLTVAPPDDATVDTQLAEELVQGLTAADALDPDLLSDDASVLLDLLGGDSGLVTFAAEVTTPADAVVVIAGPIVVAEDLPAEPTVSLSPAPTPSAASTPATEPTAASPSTTAAQDAQLTSWVQIAVAAQRRSAGSVVVTDSPADPGLVLAIRRDGELTTSLTTVDDVLSPAGTVAVPLALANRVSGTVGQFGRGEGATSPMPPRVTLPQVERIPATPADPTQLPDGEATTVPPADETGQTG